MRNFLNKKNHLKKLKIRLLNKFLNSFSKNHKEKNLFFSELDRKLAQGSYKTKPQKSSRKKIWSNYGTYLRTTYHNLMIKQKGSITISLFTFQHCYQQNAANILVLQLSSNLKEMSLAGLKLCHFSIM